MRVLVIGDSHLARLVARGSEIGPSVDNRAVGGSTALDLAGQLAGVAVSSYDVVVVSVGTNDAGWRDVSLADFVEALSAAVAAVAPLPVVLVTTPGSDPVRAPGFDVARLQEYAARAALLVPEAGGVVVDTPTVLAPLGAGAFLDDGFHLTEAAYDLLLPAIAAAVRAAGPHV